MKRSKLLGAILACSVSLVSSPLYASIIIYDFTGTVTDAGNIAGVNAALNDTITGSFAYDTSKADSNPSDVTKGDYIDFLVTPAPMIMLPSGSITFDSYTSVFVNVDTDITIAAGAPDPTVPGNNLGHDITFSLKSTSTALATDALPTSIDLNDFDSITGAFSSFSLANGPAGDPIFYSIDALTLRAIPVPAAVWLFGSGLLGLVGVVRRKAA